jgi:2-methylcitrate dehydratase PrpD
MDVTARVARFVIECQFNKIPAKALDTARTGMRDCLGVALAGSTEQSAKLCADIARNEAAREEATVIGHRFKSSALQAAFANGTASHALDFDHSFTLMGQPTAPIIPAAFTMGESLGVSGQRLLEAYVAGFEVTGKLVHSLHDSSETGWHGPGTLGVFGATVACAKLLGLNVPQIEMALGIAASMAGGVAANFGTMTKPLHVGLAARNGVLAAKLAGAGFTANARAIEAAAGFYDMFYHSSMRDGRPLEELGRSYSLETDGIRIKPYPCGGLVHPAIDATLEMRVEHGITADLIKSIDVDVTKHTYGRIAFRVPETGLQGKFCMGYLLARAVIDGKISLDHFTDQAVCDRNVLELAAKVQMRLDPNLESSNASGRPCRVTIHLKNGQTHSRQAEHARGSPEIPMTQDELKTKFSECARRVIDDQSIARTLEYLEQLETLDDVGPLGQLLMG